jgi:cyclic-di-GMP phosphodiesterase TipF (flagellum assembly factor)
VQKEKASDIFSPVSHPGIWLTLYGCGSALTSAVVANIAGGTAGGMAAGFLALAGALGYEVLSRWNTEEELRKKVSTLRRSQTLLSEEIEKVQTEIEDSRYHTAPPLRATPAPAAPKKNADPEETVSAFPSPRKYADLAVKALQKKAANAERQPDISETPAPEPAPHFSDAVISELLHHAAQNERIETFAQPIVRLPSRRLAYIEMFARIRARAGVYLAAGQYRDMAQREDLISNIDHLLLLQAFDLVRTDLRRGGSLGYFLNISGDTLTNAEYVGDLVDFVRRTPAAAARIIFEFQQADFDLLSAKGLAVMDALRKLGFRFSLDHISNPALDVRKLHDSGIRYIKLDSARLVGLAQTDDGEHIIKNLKSKMDLVDMTLIVERLETEHDLKELLDFEIDYGEGYLFGKPDLEIAYRRRRSA